MDDWMSIEYEWIEYEYEWIEYGWYTNPELRGYALYLTFASVSGKLLWAAVQISPGN